jgi:5-methylcytosine-specific restriction endonuclease McrA
MCAGFGVKRLATEVDHIVSRAERPDLTFTWSNLQGLCIPHHNSAKARDENAGYSDATASDGWPSDPKHPQNR